MASADGRDVKWMIGVEKISIDPTRSRKYLTLVRQIGPYLLSRRIGAGGMAEVWMARRASLGASKTLAIKLLAPNLAAKPEYRKMFVEEARLSMLLNNSRLVQVFDAGEHAGECYIAMEWIDGVNLAELQATLWERGTRLPVDVAMFITGEVLRALHYAHNLVHEGASSIVHRDVSPQNVMLSMAGEVKLADFGVARFSTEETTGLHVKGKLRYMAPEQLHGSSRDATVDVFAVGAILHEMLEGHKFRGPFSDDPRLLSMILAGGIPELGDARGVPVELDMLRRGMLMPDARQRVPSALMAVQILERCPGYRNMSLDLEALIREHRMLTFGSANSRPRTGSLAQLMPAMSDHQLKDTEVSRRLGCVDNPPTGTERRPSGQVVNRNRRRAAAVVVAFAGFVVGGLGVGIAIQDFAAEPSEPWLAEVVAVAPNREPEVEVVEPATPPVATPIVEARPPGELEVGAEPGPEPEPAAPPPKPKRVKVQFSAGDFGFLFLKVGSKTLVLEPNKQIDLPPGKHKLRIRRNENAEWQSLSVDIPKKPCRVAFKRPNLAQVTPL